MTGHVTLLDYSESQGATAVFLQPSSIKRREMSETRWGIKRVRKMDTGEWQKTVGAFRSANYGSFQHPSSVLYKP